MTPYRRISSDAVERLCWTDLSGVRGKAVVGSAVENHHADGQVTYLPETVQSITPDAGGYRIDLQGGRQAMIRIPEEWVTTDD